MSKITTLSGSASGTPSGYDPSYTNNVTEDSNYPISNAYTDSSSSTYARLKMATGSRVSSYISLLFSSKTLSLIPVNAIINSVTCYVKGRVSSTSYIASAVFQLYSGASVKGSSVSFRSTTLYSYEFTSAMTGSWTAAELQNLRLRATATRGTSNTTRDAFFYINGATLSVSYTYDKVTYEVTASASVPGITINPANRDVNPGGSLYMEIRGSNIDNITSVTDNGTDVTSLLVYYPEEEYEGVVYPAAYYYQIDDIQEDHVIIVYATSARLPIRVKRSGAVVTATKLLVKRNGDWEESTIEAKNNGSWN